MKTSRRHELQTNELADSLAHFIEAVKPYTRAGVALLVAIVALVFAWSYLSAQSNRKAAEGWNAIFEALGSRDQREELADVSARYAGTQIGLWARVNLAEFQLNDGTNRLFVDRKAARDELHDAAEEYRAVLIEARDPMLLQRATFGLARAHEALGTPNDLESARKEYRSIGEQWPDSPYAKDAAQRAKDLDLASTKTFYDWLARYEPPAPLAGEPGTPGTRPDFLKDPLEGAAGQLPSTIKSALPKFGDEPAAGPTLGDEPTTGDVPPAESASDKPADAPPPNDAAPEAASASPDEPAAPTSDPPAEDNSQP